MIQFSAVWLCAPWIRNETWVMFILIFPSKAWVIQTHSVQDAGMTSLRPVSQVAMLICAGFLIAWIPYAVVSVVSAFGSPDSVPIPVSVIPTLLAKSSAMYNPIIYQVVDLKHSCARSACFKALKERRHFRKTRYDVCFYAWLAAPPTFSPQFYGRYSFVITASEIVTVWDWFTCVYTEYNCSNLAARVGVSYNQAVWYWFVLHAAFPYLSTEPWDCPWHKHKGCIPDFPLGILFKYMNRQWYIFVGASAALLWIQPGCVLEKA